MKLTQKRVSARTAFTFGDDQLSYSMRFGSSVHAFVVDYFRVDRARRHTARHDWARFRSGVLFSLVGAAAMFAQSALTGPSQWLALWLVPGLILMSLFTFVRGHYVELRADGEALWVIDNGSTASIIAEIDRRRRDQLAEYYGPLNLANEPYLEIRKIEWLVEESVFTREEADLQIGRIHALAEAKADAVAQSHAAPGVFAREALAI
jgi:hypothetical protein